MIGALGLVLVAGWCLVVAWLLAGGRGLWGVCALGVLGAGVGVGVGWLSWCGVVGECAGVFLWWTGALGVLGVSRVSVVSGVVCPACFARACLCGWARGVYAFWFCACWVREWWCVWRVWVSFACPRALFECEIR